MSTQRRLHGRISKVLAAALLTGAVSASALMLATQLRAQTPTPAEPPAPAAAPSPAAAPAPATAGSIPAAEIPFFAEWARSPHANKKAEPFNHWNKEGNIPVECARCHSTPGFRDFLGADGSTPGKVDHTAPVGTVITCVACHNDKTLALTSVTFPSGKKAMNQGSAAICMSCHQGVESVVSVDKALGGLAGDTVEPKLEFINVHYGAAGAMLFGAQARAGYEYPGKTYVGRFAHKEPYVTCTSCHELHTVAVKVDDCAACHREVTDKASLRKIRISKADRDGNGDVNEGVAQEVEHLRDKLLAAILDYAKTVNGKPIVYELEAYPYFFYDKNGNGEVDSGEAIFPNRYKAWTPRLMKAAYNYQFITKDPGAYAHNGAYAIELLQDSLNDLGTKVKVDLGKAVRP